MRHIATLNKLMPSSAFFSKFCEYRVGFKNKLQIFVVLANILICIIQTIFEIVFYNHLHI